MSRRSVRLHLKSLSKLDILSKDIILIVFGFLKKKDLLQITTINKKLSDFSLDNNLWHWQSIVLSDSNYINCLNMFELKRYSKIKNIKILFNENNKCDYLDNFMEYLIGSCCYTVIVIIVIVVIVAIFIFLLYDIAYFLNLYYHFRE